MPEWSWRELDRLRAEYQRRSEDAGQGWIEHWPAPDQEAADLAQAAAGAAWLAAVHAAWPAIRYLRVKESGGDRFRLPSL